MVDSMLDRYVRERALGLIEQADSGQVDQSTSAMAEWIGAATWVLKELTRNA
jgi:hypothetical protein